MSVRASLAFLISVVLSTVTFAGEESSPKLSEPALKRGYDTFVKSLDRERIAQVFPAAIRELDSRRLTIGLGADGKAQIEVILVPDEREVMVGEPLHLTFTVHNLSDIDLQAVQGFDQMLGSGPRMYYIRVVDGKGRVLPDRDEPCAFSVQYVPEPIPAKGTWRHRLFLPEWVRLTAIGDYYLLAKTTLKFRKYNTGAPWRVRRYGPCSLTEHSDKTSPPTRSSACLTQRPAKTSSGLLRGSHATAG